MPLVAEVYCIVPSGKAKPSKVVLTPLTRPASFINTAFGPGCVQNTFETPTRDIFDPLLLLDIMVSLLRLFEEEVYVPIPTS